MAMHHSWSIYWTAVAVLTGIYYLVVTWLFLRPNNKPERILDEKPTPPTREPWLDQTLAVLEETVLHAQKKRYHPDEILEALRLKVKELKGGSSGDAS